MGKSAPSAPAPPDPVKTAQAQAALNKETAIAQSKLNRVNEYTPYGSSVWEQEPEAERTFTPKWESVPIYGERRWIEEPGSGWGEWSEPEITGYKQVQTNLEPDPLDPLDRMWERRTTLDPEQQSIYDKQNKVINALNDVAVSQVGRVSTALGDPFTYEGIPAAGTTGGIRTAADRARQVAGSGFDYAGLPYAPGASGVYAAAQRAAGSVETPFNLGGTAPSTGQISEAANRAQAGMDQPFNYAGLPGAADAGGIASAAGRIGAAAGEQFDYTGLPGAADAGRIGESASRAEASVSQPFNYGGLPGAFDTAGAQSAVQRATDAYGTPFDYSGAPAAPGGDAAARQQVIDSVYGQYASRLDPKFAGEMQAMETKLANSGIARGTQAFSSAMDDFYRGRNDAYQTAQNAAIQAGGAEQSRLFGLGTSARQNAIAEQNYLRSLPGAEQGQLLGYQGQLSGLQGQARADAAGERLTERGIPIQEAAELQALRGAEFDASSAARDRSVQEQLLQRGIPAQEQAQIQQMQRSAFDTQAAQRDRSIQEALTQRAVPLAEQQQIYGMEQGLFGLDQAARQRAIEESAYLRNLPLNETSALLSGNQIMNPQFGAAPQTGIANTDYSGLVSNNYAAQVSAANAKAASQSANTGAVIGGIATVAAAAF